MKSLMAMRQTAVELFAASILEICPKIVLIETKATKLGFYCDFLSPFPINQEYIHLIEEKMRGKKGEFKILEMTSNNAKDYLRYLKQPLRKEKVDAQQQFTRILQLDTYANVCLEEVIPFHEMGVFSLEGVTEEREILFHKKKQKVTRVFGYVAENKEALTIFRKKVREGKKSDHIKRGLEWNLFFENEGEICWLPEGIKLRQRIVEALRELEFEEIAFKEGDFKKYIPFGCKKIFRFIEKNGTLERDFGLKGSGLRLLWEGIDLENRDKQKSLLHLNNRLDKILPLKASTLKGSGRGGETALSAEDGYGISWEIVESSGEVVRVLVDRLVALVIERSSTKESLFSSF